MFNTSNKRYISAINAGGIFNNTYETRIPQTVVGKAILSHFEQSDKIPKCLFIGWDGCRGDAMKYLIKSNDEKISGANETNEFSAITQLKKVGGLYVSYVGGETSSPQETSTAQGWASALCGKWMKKEYKQGIEWSLDDSFPTAMKSLALKGYKSSFNAIWPIHFDNTYVKEIENAQKNNLPQYYFKFETDSELHKNLMERISSDDDFIFGIYENPDCNGHGTGFGDDNYRYVSGVCNLDRLSYILMKEIKNRPDFKEEDWLVIIASDHGGHSTRHGTQRIEDRTTFLAISKPIESFNV